jgi:hypothetical protein
MDLPILPGNALDLPRLGFGLWQLPDVSALVELLLVLGGAWLYWRAARAAERANSRGNRWADISAAAVLLSGLVVLGLDFTGILG